VKCSNHQMVVVFVTRTGWEVVQCWVCGVGDVVLPEGRMCGCSECDGKRRPKDWEHSS
jgi:hypothetical protein